MRIHIFSKNQFGRQIINCLVFAGIFLLSNCSPRVGTESSLPISAHNDRGISLPVVQGGISHGGGYAPKSSIEQVQNVWLQIKSEGFKNLANRLAIYFHFIDIEVFADTPSAQHARLRRFLKRADRDFSKMGKLRRSESTKSTNDLTMAPSDQLSLAISNYPLSKNNYELLQSMVQHSEYPLLKVANGEVGQIQFLDEPGQKCFEGSEPRDGSATGTIENGSICIDLQALTRLPPEDLEVELMALYLHDLAHLYNIEHPLNFALQAFFRANKKVFLGLDEVSEGLLRDPEILNKAEWLPYLLAENQRKACVALIGHHEGTHLAKQYRNYNLPIANAYLAEHDAAMDRITRFLCHRQTKSRGDLIEQKKNELFVLVQQASAILNAYATSQFGSVAGIPKLDQAKIFDADPVYSMKVDYMSGNKIIKSREVVGRLRVEYAGHLIVYVESDTDLAKAQSLETAKCYIYGGNNVQRAKNRAQLEQIKKGAKLNCRKPVFETTSDGTHVLEPFSESLEIN